MLLTHTTKNIRTASLNCRFPPGMVGLKKSYYLGDYSPEKEAFMQQIMPMYGATYQEWANWTDWNPIFRYELAAYNSAHPDAPYGFTFPEVDTKPSYWDELPYLGEYSEAKRVFIWITLMPMNYGNVDGWFLGAPSEGEIQATGLQDMQP